MQKSAQARPWQITSQLQIHATPWHELRSAALSAWQRVGRRHHLTGNSWQVLELITRLQWWHATHSPSRAAYATPGEAFLADRLNVARETVSDAIQYLAAHGLLHVIRRRPQHGRFVTNLYQIAASLAGHLLALRRRSTRQPGGRYSKPPAGALRETTTSHALAHTALGELYDRWMQRGQPQEGKANG